MNKHLVFAAALSTLAVCVLSGCGRGQSSSTEVAQSAAPVNASDPSWCNRGGMDAAKDPACKRQADKDFNKFIGKGGGS